MNLPAGLLLAEMPGLVRIVSRSSALWPVVLVGGVTLIASSPGHELSPVRQQELTPAEVVRLTALSAADVGQPAYFDRFVDSLRKHDRERAATALDYEIVKIFKNPVVPGNCYYDRLLHQAPDTADTLPLLNEATRSLDEHSYRLRFEATWAAVTNSGCPDSARAQIWKRYLRSRAIDIDDSRAVMDYIARVASDYDLQFIREAADAAGRGNPAQNLLGFRDRSGLYITSIFDTAFRIDRLLAGKDFPPVRRVLVVGPGLNIVDQFLGTQVPVSSPQPLCLLESLLAHGLADSSTRVNLLDLNPEVIAHWDECKRRPRSASALYRLLGYLTCGSKVAALSPHTRAYLGGFGARGPALNRALFANRAPAQELLWKDAAGRLTRVGDATEGVCFRDLLVSPRAFDSFVPVYGDIVTDEVAAPGTYDLIVCTNLLVYFKPAEAALAVFNMNRYLKTGGRLIVTEELESLLPEGYSLARVRKDKLEGLVQPGAPVPAFFVYRRS